MAAAAGATALWPTGDRAAPTAAAGRTVTRWSAQANQNRYCRVVLVVLVGGGGNAQCHAKGRMFSIVRNNTDILLSVEMVGARFKLCYCYSLTD